MTTMKAITFLTAISCVSFLSFGCGSSSENHVGSTTGGSAGASGAATGGDAGQASGGSGGSGGSGAGGVAGSGGGDAGSSTGGNAGTGPCVPKTCLTYAVEHGAKDACGVIQDGCGNYINCAGCDAPADPATECGGAMPATEDTQWGPQWTGQTNSDPALCGGGCTMATGSDPFANTCQFGTPGNPAHAFKTSMVCTTQDQNWKPATWVCDFVQNTPGTGEQENLTVWCCTGDVSYSVK